jgi:hypothetical protein
LNEKKSIIVSIIGSLLGAFSFLGSTLYGFGGFSLKTFSEYVMVGYVSRLQMIFLFLVGLGLALSGVGYIRLTKRKIRRYNFISLSFMAVSVIFFSLAVFGLTSRLGSPEFWADTTFTEIQNVLFFNNMSLISFFAFGVLQLILSIMLFKTKIFQEHQLSTVAKILTVISGILLIAKSVIDYPLIKEVIFVLSYEFKIPILNSILSITAPLIYLIAQLLYTRIYGIIKILQ